MNARHCFLLWLSVFCFGLPDSLFAQAPQFTRAQRLTNQEIALTVSGPVNRAYRVETATNFVDWNPLITFATNLTSSILHTDSATPYLPGRYYRAVQLVGTNIAGDHLSTTNGDLILQPHQHAAVIMNWNGKTIHIDPKNDVFSYNGKPRGDLVLVTHEHSDHFNTTTIDVARSNNAPIICPAVVYTNLLPAQKPVATVLTNGMTTNIFGVTVEAVPASNGNHPLGRGNGYVLTFGGKRIYFTGDTGTNALYAITNIDVAFVAMNSFTMTVTDAAKAVRQIRPKVVYPYHYSGTSASDILLFKQLVGTDLGIEVRLRKWY
jgi:L-ascorbate metabolism protein UlaG (beta-lactamase superfamily)